LLWGKGSQANQASWAFLKGADEKMLLSKASISAQRKLAQTLGLRTRGTRMGNAGSAWTDSRIDRAVFVF